MQREVSTFMLPLVKLKQFTKSFSYFEAYYIESRNVPISVSCISIKKSITNSNYVMYRIINTLY